MSHRFTFFVLALALVVGSATAGFGQNGDPEAAAAVASGGAGYVRVAPTAVDLSQPPQLTLDSSIVLDAETGAVVGAASGQAGANSNANAGASNEGRDGDEH